MVLDAEAGIIALSQVAQQIDFYIFNIDSSSSSLLKVNPTTLEQAADERFVDLFPQNPN
jgi:CO dehydrogenase nickel-insertion accessory protein CooC1